MTNPPTGPHQFTYNPPPQPPKKTHHWYRPRNLFLAAVAFVVLIVVIVVASSSGGTKTTNTVQAGSAQPAATQPAYTPSAAPTTPGPTPPTEVEFVISGDVPAQSYDEVDINYGANNDSHQVTLSDLHGTVTYKVPFDANAEYYSMDVDIEGGSVSCKIVATGPGDQPLTVSSAKASGNNICDAQAAPENNGLNWDNEQ